MIRISSKTYKVRDVYGLSRDVPINYVTRHGIDDKLVDCLTRGQHIVIYGSSKQGKTSLRKHNLKETDYVVVSCQNNFDLRQLHAVMLKSIGFTIQESTSRTVDGRTKIDAHYGFELGIPGLAKTSVNAGGEAGGGISTTANTKALELDPADANEVIAAFKSVNFKQFMILEDFHYLPLETQQDFAVSLKAFHENSRITFIIVAVWREENRLILFNGDLAGRMVAVDADAWSQEQLLKVIASGEPMLNVSIDPEFQRELVEKSFESVYIVQEACRRVCVDADLHETSLSHKKLLPRKKALTYVQDIVREQGARYKSFLQTFASGFLTTDLSMYKWILYPILQADISLLEKGLSYRYIRETIESRHPEGKRLKPGNLTQALQQISNLQTKKNLKPFILDYDSANLLLSVVDKGFLVWLQSEKRDELFDLVDLDVNTAFEL